MDSKWRVNAKTPECFNAKRILIEKATKSLNLNFRDYDMRQQNRDKIDILGLELNSAQALFFAHCLE